MKSKLVHAAMWDQLDYSRDNVHWQRNRRTRRKRSTRFNNFNFTQEVRLIGSLDYLSGFRLLEFTWKEESKDSCMTVVYYWSQPGCCNCQWFKAVASSIVSKHLEGSRH